jgi:hypothetical protein
MVSLGRRSVALDVAQRLNEFHGMFISKLVKGMRDVERHPEIVKALPNTLHYKCERARPICYG